MVAARPRFRYTRPDFTIIDDLKSRVKSFIAPPTEFAAMDTEATGLRILHGDRPFFVSGVDQSGRTVCWRASEIHYGHRIITWKPKQLREIQAYFDRQPVVYFHNAKFDVRALRSIGLNIPWEKIRCTLLNSHVINSAESHNLKYLCKEYCGIDDDDQQAMVKSIESRRRALFKELGIRAAEYPCESSHDYLNADPDLLETYGVRDAVRAATLAMTQLIALDKLNLGLNSIAEHELMPVIYEMESLGIPVNMRTLISERKRFTAASEAHLRTLLTIAKQRGFRDFNPRSNPQLTALLYGPTNGKKLLPSQRSFRLSTRATGTSTDKDSLALHLADLPNTNEAHKFITALKGNRVNEKADSYLAEYQSLAIQRTERFDYHPENRIAARLHTYHALSPNFNQVGNVDNGMRSTRLTSSDPNGQNISKKADMPLRRVFIPRLGHYWVDCDYDNLEMRILAYASNEKRLIELFEQGGSYHEYIAELLYGPKHTWKGLDRAEWKNSPEYKRVKNGNFSLGYGAGRAKADATYGVDGAYDLIKKTFVSWTAYNRKWVEFGEKHGYVETLFGYRLTIDPRRAFTTALNGVIQGTAGGVTKYAMLAIDSCPRIARAHGEQLFNVHDQLLVEFPLNKTRQGICQRSVVSSVLNVKYAMEYPGRYLGMSLTASPDVVGINWIDKAVCDFSTAV